MNELSTYSDFQTSIETNNWVMVYVSANWCKPCQTFAPVVEKSAQAYKNILNTVKVDIEHIPEVGGAYGLKSVPTLMLFHRGKLVEGTVGAQTSSQVSNWLMSKLLTY